MESELRGLLNRPDAFDSAFAEAGLARDLLAANPMSPDYPDAVERFKAQLIEFVEQGRDSGIGKWLKADNRFFTHLSGLDPYEIATDIMLWHPDDRLVVRYRPRPGANFEPVDRQSLAPANPEAVGTLQSKAVRDAVCLILEGGEDAIRARFQRLVDPGGR